MTKTCRKKSTWLITPCFAGILEKKKGIKMLESILIFIAFACFATAESTIFHPRRWQHVPFMHYPGTSNAPVFLRIFGDGFHVFKNIGIYLLFISGCLIGYQWQGWREGVGLILYLSAVATISFNLFLHVIFKEKQ